MKETLMIVLVVLATGCAAFQSPMRDDPNFAPKYPSTDRVVANTNGSLFADSGYISLFDDAVARHVGDIITVRLNERTTSTKSASTNISKDTDSTVSEPILFGKKVRGILTNGGNLNELGSENDFSGSADSDQSNSLQGNIAVTISEILPNGTFVIRGEKWMQLNQGDEYIRIVGMVRQVDIDSDNSIDSTKIANARITYGGKGMMDDSNKMGWLARFFISPVFAY